MPSKRCSFATCATALLLTCPLSQAENLAPPLKLGDRAPWRVHGPLGGAATEDTKTGTVLLLTERVSVDEDESWEGCITTRPKVEAIPGRRYRLSVEARGYGQLTLGLFEYPWKYSEKLLGSPGEAHALTEVSRNLTFDYVCSSDRVAHIRPYLRLTGWHARAELRNCSLEPVLAPGTVTAEAAHFIVELGAQMNVKVRSSHWPVKLLLYGPSGESGPAGPMGGSGAWTDHFKTSTMQESRAEELTCPVDLKDMTVEGTYRLVVIAPQTGQAATVRFAARPPARVKQIPDLVQQVKVPDGSRLMFVGDSLTALFPNRSYVALLNRALKWRSGGKIEVINAAVSGNNIRAISGRLDKDVLACEPTHVFIFEGANDTKRYYDPAKQALRDWAVPPPLYEETLRQVVSRIQEGTKAAVIMMTCAPGNQDCTRFFQERSRRLGLGGNLFCMPDEIEKVVTVQKRVAADLALQVIDANALLARYMADRKQAGSSQYAHVDDGVHLSEYGSREVALAVLRYLAK